jgi:predicted DNA-binding ribbon-helix-helix protein
MPNQRKKGMAHLGCYVEASLKLRLQAIAADRKITLTDLLTELLQAEVQNYQERAARGKLSKSSSSFPVHQEEQIVLEDKPVPKRKTGT